MNRTLSLVVILTLFALFAPLAVKADGMIMPPPDYWMYESGQRAVLLYDEKSKSETLVVGIQFQGNAKDFAWILPVPSEPVVSQGSEEIFTSLDQLTGRSGYMESYLNVGLGAAKDSEQPVTVVRTQTIDYYSVATLKSTDSRALAAWLNENGYQYPAGSEYILNSYITNQWYFVAVKIDASSLAQGQAALHQGSATPLKLVFSARNPVYPMRISSVTGTVAATSPTNTNSSLSPLLNIEDQSSSPGYYRPSSVNVELYVLAKHKQTVPGFSTGYGNWVNKKTIKSWAVDNQGDALLQPAASKYFLTKLTRSMTSEQMTEDLFPRQAANDKKVTNGTSVSRSFTDGLLLLLAMSFFTVIVFTVGIFSPFGIAFIIATVVQHRCTSRGWRIAAWIVQIGVAATYAIIGAVLALAGLASSSSLLDVPREIVGSASSNPSDLNVLWVLTLMLPIGAIIALFILILFWQVRRHKADQATMQFGPE